MAGPKVLTSAYAQSPSSLPNPVGQPEAPEIPVGRFPAQAAPAQGFAMSPEEQADLLEAQQGAQGPAAEAAPEGLSPEEQADLLEAQQAASGEVSAENQGETVYSEPIGPQEAPIGPPSLVFNGGPQVTPTGMPIKPPQLVEYPDKTMGIVYKGKIRPLTEREQGAADLMAMALRIGGPTFGAIIGEALGPLGAAIGAVVGGDIVDPLAKIAEQAAGQKPHDRTWTDRAVEGGAAAAGPFVAKYMGSAITPSLARDAATHAGQGVAAAEKASVPAALTAVQQLEAKGKEARAAQEVVENQAMDRQGLPVPAAGQALSEDAKLGGKALVQEKLGEAGQQVAQPRIHERAETYVKKFRERMAVRIDRMANVARRKAGNTRFNVPDEVEAAHLEATGQPPTSVSPEGLGQTGPTPDFNYEAGFSTQNPAGRQTQLGKDLHLGKTEKQPHLDVRPEEVSATYEVQEGFNYTYGKRRGVEAKPDPVTGREAIRGESQQMNAPLKEQRKTPGSLGATEEQVGTSVESQPGFRFDSRKEQTGPNRMLPSNQAGPARKGMTFDELEKLRKHAQERAGDWDGPPANPEEARWRQIYNRAVDARDNVAEIVLEKGLRSHSKYKPEGEVIKGKEPVPGLAKAMRRARDEYAQKVDQVRNITRALRGDGDILEQLPKLDLKELKEVLPADTYNEIGVRLTERLREATEKGSGETVKVYSKIGRERAREFLGPEVEANVHDLLVAFKAYESRKAATGVATAVLEKSSKLVESLGRLAVTHSKYAMYRTAFTLANQIRGKVGLPRLEMNSVAPIRDQVSAGVGAAAGANSRPKPASPAKPAAKEANRSPQGKTSLNDMQDHVNRLNGGNVASKAAQPQESLDMFAKRGAQLGDAQMFRAAKIAYENEGKGEYLPPAIQKMSNKYKRYLQLKKQVSE